MQNLGTLAQYTLLSIKDQESFGIYYSARDNETNINYIIYIQNAQNNNNNIPANEINILNLLNNSNNPYILHCVNHGNGQLILNNQPPRNAFYIVYENAQNYLLYDYMRLGGLGENRAKLLFKKIVLGIQAIHNANICHRDIMTESIYLDDNYNPKIFNFGFSSLNAGNLQEYLGSEGHAAPEILAHHPYNGFKLDIFNLGQLLFILVNGIFGFTSARNTDIYYNLIMLNNYDEYWHNQRFQNLNLSNSFKDLYLRMVSYQPNERPTIDEILNSPWLQDINNLNQQQILDLENEIIQELHNREAQIQNLRNQEMNI